MKRLCTVDQVRAAERAAVAAGRDETQLMLQAGHTFADLIASVSGGPGTALFLVGPGKNGGDGLVAADHLAYWGWRCLVCPFGRQGLGSAPLDPSQGSHLHWITHGEELQQAADAADLVVDAIFGIGGRTELPPEVRAAIEIVQRSRIERGSPVWALDIPSGTDADSGAAGDGAVVADATAMIGLPKIGLYRTPALRHAGHLWLADIGLEAPEEANGNPAVVEDVDARRMLPRRRRDTHKSAVGWLMVVGGASSYYGAPRMAGHAALRVGAGLVSLAVPDALVVPLATALAEATFLPLPSGTTFEDGVASAAIVADALPRYQALVVGPGLGREARVDGLLSGLLGIPASTPAESAVRGVAGNRQPFRGKAVIDADGLNWLARNPGWHERLREAELVLTPHPGELSRLTGKPVAEIERDPWLAAREAADRFRQVVVLKQAHSIVAAPGRGAVLGSQSEPALASAGTGDVLAGTIGGLLAQGLPAWDAAVTGLHVAGKAAELAVARSGTLGLVATDVIASLAGALQTLYDPNWSRKEVEWLSTWTWPGS